MNGVLVPRKRTPKSAKREADRIFSLIVRSLGYCEKCGRENGEVQLQCSHWISRRYSNTRTDFDNAFSMCAACHRWWHNFPTDASDWAIEKRGRETYERIREAANQTSKIDWLEELERLREIAKREDVKV